MAALAPRLRHRVTIKTPTVTQNPTTGEMVESWAVLFCGVPAEVLTGPGREPFTSAQFHSDTTARITTRWFACDPHDLQKLRIEWDGRDYDVKAFITDATARRWYRFECVDGMS